MAQVRWGVKEPYRLRGKAFIEKIRMKVGDSIVNKFSDHEILVALNEAIDMLWRELAAEFSTITQKVVEYQLDGADLLPEDFYSLERLECVDGVQFLRDGFYDTPYYIHHSMHEVLDRPHIVGSHIVGKGHVRLIYNYLPRAITLPESVIDVPLTLENDLVSIASNVLMANMDGATQRSVETARRVSQKREFANLPPRKAFP